VETVVTTLIDQLGGPAALQPIIDEFVDRIVVDPMIGFHFSGVDIPRLKVLEAQFAAVALGGEIAYEGRPVRQAHRGRPISGGQFARRREILRQVLVERQVSVEVAQAWLAHTDRLRSAIVQGPQDRCGVAGSFGPLISEVAADGSVREP
jgi:hemoglobin